MKRFAFPLLFIVLLAASVAVKAQLQCHAVCFYNLENLFDTARTS